MAGGYRGWGSVRGDGLRGVKAPGGFALGVLVGPFVLVGVYPGPFLDVIKPGVDVVLLALGE